MNIEEAREYCISLKGATEGFPFDESTLVFKVMGKMFALADLDSADYISLKCEPNYALELREHYSAITAAYHMNKKHWNSVLLNGDANDELIKKLITHSYEEVIKKFTKKMRNEYDQLL